MNIVSDRVVIKFGGADLSTGGKIRHAADLVAKSPYKEKVVVVSAMSNTTDTLVGAINQIGNVNDEDYAEVLSMGERTSARIFCSALKAQGAEAVVFDPANDNWPLVTDSDFRDAKPDIGQVVHCSVLAEEMVADIDLETHVRLASNRSPRQH